VATGLEDTEDLDVRCAVCGGELAATITDLPFKVSETRIVIVKSLPVLACGNCPEYLLEDATMGKVDEILARVNDSAELEIVRFAA
jgi:YgiT-type zinc finger domain-containing protein